MKFKAIIFDFDGVLVDSVAIWQEIDHMLFEKFNLPLDKLEDFQREICGMNVEVVSRHYVEKFGIGCTPEEFEKIIMNTAYESFEKRVKPKKNIEDLLILLSREGYRIGVASSNEKDIIQLNLKANNLYDYFNKIVTSAEVDRHKPFPDVYLKAAEILGVNPDECLVFEDTVNGVTAGKSAGMTVYGIYDKFSECLMEKIKDMSDNYFLNYIEVIEFLKNERVIK